MALQHATDRLRTGLRVEGCDGQPIGTITEVWADAGVGEAWGSVGAQPIEGADGADPVQCAFCEAMPGEGESYFRLRTSEYDLYVPFSYLGTVRDNTAVLSIAATDVPAMQWDVRPDFLANRHVPDSGAASDRA